MVLVTVSFSIGGLLGGIVGGGLVLWASGFPLSTSPTPLEMADPLLCEPVASETPLLSSTPTPTQIPTLTPTSAPPTATATLSLADSVARVLPAVVTIVNQRSTAGTGGNDLNTRIRGSGTIIDARGYIATNYHVVQGAGQLTVILSTGQELSARLVALDAQREMALVRVERENLPVAVWGDSNAVRLGEWVVAIGSALGDFPNSVTVGVISGINRSVDLDGTIRISGLIQTDAAINKGNSGGPLVNQRGEVIGINTFLIRENRRVGVAEGISFAIPSALAREILEQWIAADVQRSDSRAPAP
ncbi:MAG: S1C family serine protease [Anaerolineae bacterium]